MSNTTEMQEKAPDNDSRDESPGDLKHRVRQTLPTPEEGQPVANMLRTAQGMESTTVKFMAVLQVP